MSKELKLVDYVSKKEETLNDHIAYVVGRLIVSIGTGDFTDMVKLYLLDMHGRGFRAGQKAKVKKTK
jgi:hypothetical protein